MVASITWVSQRHQCLSQCTVEEESAQQSCCDTQNEIVFDADKSCCSDHGSCSDKDCCVEEKIILDKTIDDLERTQRKDKSLALFDFLFVPLTQEFQKPVLKTDSFQLYEYGEARNAGGSVSIYLLNQNFRC